MAEPDKLPLAVAGSNQHSDGVGTEEALLEKYAWQQDRAIQFNPTLAIYRFSLGGAYDPATHQRGTWTLVPNLSAIPCWTDDFSFEWQRRFGATEKTGAKVFVFYETAALTGLVSNDQIRFDDVLYEIIELNHDTDTGRFEALGHIIKG
jgi:hypothetical protein